MSFIQPIALWGHFVVLVIVLAGCSYYELKERRLPNFITLPALGLGLGFSVLPSGISPSSSMLGAGLGFSVLYFIYSLGGIGAGDVKLMAAVGALLGHPLIISVMVSTSVIGAGMALVVLLYKQDVNRGFRRMALVFQPGGASQLADSSDTLTLLPYGMAIVCGTLVTLLWGGVV